MSISQSSHIEKSYTKCPICKLDNIVKFKPQSFFFPSSSDSNIFLNHNNDLCYDCGIVFLNPVPSDKKLTEHYNNSYRNSNYSISFYNKKIDLPIQFPESAHSFFRFKNFLTCLENLKNNNINFNFNNNHRVLDLGGYQGMFLNAFSQLYNINGIVADLNENGIHFAKNTFNFTESIVIKSPQKFYIKQKVDLVTMIHSFEHMRDPIGVLNHLKNQILIKNGLVYIEVPNLFGSPLNDPVHFFTFTADSLTYILNKAGFKVLEIFNCGNQHAPMTINNDELVIVCMAQASDTIISQFFKNDNSNLPNQILNNYNLLSKKVIKKQFFIALNEFTKLLYYIFGNYILKLFFKDLRLGINKLKKKFKFSLH